MKIRSLVSSIVAHPKSYRAQVLTAVTAVLLVWGLFIGNLSALVKTPDRVLDNQASGTGEPKSLPWNTKYELNPNKIQDEQPIFAENSSRALTLMKYPLVFQTNGDELFQQAYSLLEQGQFAQALQIAQRMTSLYPNFQLGSLLYADLLAITSGDTTEIAQFFAKPKIHRRLVELQAEARQRTSYLNKTVLEGKRPSSILYLSPDLPKIVLVDAQRSRLYLLSNEGRGPTNATLKVVFDTYVSIGHKGIGKWREGDGKTPKGVYFTQKHLKSTMLPDLYGSGALTLDYPNPIDKAQKKTGSGIWLHGTPSKQYARPPQSTDGCVVLANDDMVRLIQHGLKANTPVIIADRLDWLDDLASESTTLDSGPNAGKPLGLNFPMPSFAQQSPDQWKLVSAFQWTDERQQMAVLSYSHQAIGAAKQLQHSYWIRQNKQWVEVERSVDQDKPNQF